MKAHLQVHSKVLLLFLLVVCLVLLLNVAPALAQEVGDAFDIAWWTVDNGGGLSANGSFSVDGTIGQVDAGILIGGDYSLSGGFWDASMGAPVPWGGRIYLPLSLRDFCGSISAEREPNNQVNDANWLCPGRFVTGSHDGTGGTGDLFCMETDKPLLLSLNTSDLDGVQLLLYVWQDDALELIEQDAADPFLISHTPVRAQQYYVYVYSDAKAVNTASYTLQTTIGLPVTAILEPEGSLPTPPPVPVGP